MSAVPKVQRMAYRPTAGELVQADYRGQLITVQLLRRRALWWRIYVTTTSDTYFLTWLHSSRIVGPAHIDDDAERLSRHDAGPHGRAYSHGQSAGEPGRGAGEHSRSAHTLKRPTPAWRPHEHDRS